MHPAKPHQSNVVIRKFAVVVAGLTAVVAGCSADVGDANTEAVGTNQLGFDDFERSVFREADSGVYIVNGDTPVVDIKHLREFWEAHVRDGALLVNQSGRRDAIWTTEQRRDLTYCVSTNFGSRYETVVAAMEEAVRAWEEIADVDFLHVVSADSSCTSSSSSVLFDVNPVNAGGQYLARAFFPGQSRSTRNVLIDRTAFGSTQPTLTGILRHELGHVLGFRHEHTRPEAGTCFEDNNWRALTEYDGASVMHYPQCNGTGDRTLNLTSKDIEGVQSLYGGPIGGGDGGGGDGGGGDGGGGGGGGTPVTETFSGRVARGAFDPVGPADGIEVVPGTTFTVVMTGTGDPDLFVKFGSAPTARSFDCRPYLSDANETCTLEVPEGETRAFIKVHGYTGSTYDIEVSYSAPGEPAAGDGTPTSTSFEGSLARRQTAPHGPIAVVPGTSFQAVLSGTGDPDLYVRFGEEPTLSTFDCRPYLDGADELCELTVPEGQSQAFLLVNAYVASTYKVDVNYTTR
ncbi:pre-peptidase C-terminal domain-containing protein [Sorangium cellulosum]|uniref:Peptidase M10 n=1 Tax=Sorangium cellulosum TaxID=56 RepID=A0A150QMV2_SORCE|nr:M57 family metalloprotease [Sorangium cellulosum]KYF69300.1 peptidase M10 [Sorangium cellulosum]